MQDDYIEEDFQDGESPSRRPFLVAVGVLVTLFILMGACTAFFIFNNRAAADRAARSAEIAAIETRNAETEAANAATAIAATEMAASIPTSTPPPTAAPTETPAPATPTPTSTPVVDEGEEAVLPETAEGDAENGETTEGGEDTAVSDESATITDGTDTATDDAAPTPISALSETGDDALPQTGLDTWGVLVVAFALVGLFVFARRMRTSG